MQSRLTGKMTLRTLFTISSVRSYDPEFPGLYVSYTAPIHDVLKVLKFHRKTIKTLEFAKFGIPLFSHAHC